MKRVLFVLVLATLLIGMVGVVGASGPTYSPAYQDAEPPTTTEPPTPIPTELPDQSDNGEHQNLCARAYDYIVSKHDKELGYTILRNRPWCRVWIALKHGKFIQVPDK